jgi:hypothetical protein
MLDRGRRGTYVSKPLLEWRRHEAGSKDPSSRGAAEAETARIRDRHAELRRRVSGPRATLAYAFDRGVGLADRLFGIARNERFLRACERASWRRFRRLG